MSSPGHDELRRWREQGRAPAGSCPFCASRISVVERDGVFVARCSHRGCGARGPKHHDLTRACDLFCCRPLLPAVTRAAEAVRGAASNAATWQSVVRDHIDDAINNPHDPSTDALIGAVCLLRDQFSLLTDQPDPMLRPVTFDEMLSCFQGAAGSVEGPAHALAVAMFTELERLAKGGGK